VGFLVEVSAFTEGTGGGGGGISAKEVVIYLSTYKYPFFKLYSVDLLCLFCCWVRDASSEVDGSFLSEYMILNDPWNIPPTLSSYTLNPPSINQTIPDQ
jgi:hypothetical protein